MSFMKKIIRKVLRFQGMPVVPGDKSLSHRALIFGAMAKGVTKIINLLESEDIFSTMRCLEQLGIEIKIKKEREGQKKGPNYLSVLVNGLGEKNIKEPDQVLDCGNSGTTMRLLLGVLASKKSFIRMKGDESLNKRPMKRVADPLRLMGAKIELIQDNFAPLTIMGSDLRGIEYVSKISSAQVKTAIMIASLSANGTTQIIEEIKSRDHTERLLPHFGVSLEVTNNKIILSGNQKLIANTVKIPSDPSSASFWIAAACLIAGSKLEIENVSLNPTRIGFIQVLKRMGAKIKIDQQGEIPEPIGNLQVTFENLRGVNILEKEIPTLIDEIPLIAIVATQAKGPTSLRGAKELRVKESDRLEAIALNLKQMGVEVELFEDGFKIEGPQQLNGAVINSFHDHRIAMAFSIAGLVAQGETFIEEAQCVAVSYPSFYETLEELTSA